jgi:hypothetical protein
MGGKLLYEARHMYNQQNVRAELLVVFRVDDSDAIQGHNSGHNSEGVKREKTVNHWSASWGASTLLIESRFTVADLLDINSNWIRKYVHKI